MNDAALFPGPPFASVAADVAAVLVNWRAASMTLEAVDRVLALSPAPGGVIVVDNGSADGSAEALRAGLLCHGDRASLILNTVNHGFGGGCNPAIRQALDDGFRWVWLLNNDATPAPDCLGHLLAAAARAAPPVGIVGSLLVDPSGHAPDHLGSWMNPFTLACGAVLTPADLERRPFGWMTAASMLVSAEAFATVGLFDMGFFMYWEDADLNMRVRSAGFTITGAPDAVVEHHAGTSSDAVPVQRYLWHYASQSLWLRKHHGSPRAALGRLRAKYLLKALLDRDLRRFWALARIISIGR